MPPAQTTTESPSALGNPMTAPPALRGPVLVATDGSDASMPALHMARLLAARGADVQVVGVVEPMPVATPPSEVPLYLPEIDEAHRQELQQRLRAQADRVLGAEKAARLDVMVGAPATELARLARDRHASMVITGLRHHGRIERLLVRGETPIGIARAARTPVLVVPYRMDHLPRTAVIAMDLDDASVHAARAARPLLTDVEKVYVVHVRSTGTTPAPATAAAWERFYAQLIRESYDRIVAALALPASVDVQSRTLTGHPVDEIVEFADFARVELIIAGYRKRLLIDRIAGARSVAERVFRSTICPMLLVPETSSLAAPEGAQTETVALADREAWAEVLDAFTRRNSGRAANLEIDTMDLGAQAQVMGFPMRDIDYEGATDTLHLMFGDATSRAPHLVHSIVRPTSVEVQRRRDGTDMALRVGHRDGYTLLTFRDRGRAGGT